MSKLLLGIIISVFLSCTIPIKPENKELEEKKTFSSYRLERNFYQENISGEELRRFVQWYHELPDSIQFGSPSFQLKVYLSEKVEVAGDTEVAMIYVNDLEKKIHMKVGFANSIPQAKIATIYRNSPSDSSYVIISVEL